MINIKLGKYGTRCAGVFFAVLLMLFIGGAGIIRVNLSGYTQTAESQGKIELTVYKHRGTIFDRNFRPLTNIPGELTAAVVASPQALTSLREQLSAPQFENLLERFSTDKPVLLSLSEPIYNDGITLFETYTRYSGLAAHIVGYTDNDMHGVSGIEASFESLLYSDDSTKISYTGNAAGGVLMGVSPTVTGGENRAVKDGVILTLDKRIQQIVEEETMGLGTGAAIVMDVENGDILALHSLPVFSQSDPAASLNSNSSPFLNRALSSYNAGSVFKSCIAVAALENGVGSEHIFNCNGSLQIGGLTFVCNRSSGHGNVDFNTAVAKSCNIYFYKLALMTDPQALYSTAISMGMDGEISLCSGISSSNCVLPSAKLLADSEAAVANFAIGQGDVMVTPLALAAAYNSIASGGIYYTPRLIYGILQNNSLSPSSFSTGKRIMSEDTAFTLKEALCQAVIEGTGTSAAPDNCTAAGKTATAQTGWIKEDTRVLQSWFAGFFPVEEPKYTVVILKENGTSGSADCAPVFRAIAQRICNELLQNGIS